MKLIEIDTNGNNANKFQQNVELYDIITPNILFLVEHDDNKITMSEEIDWVETRQYFHKGRNGHCICFKTGGYIAAQDFSHIGLKVPSDFLGKTLSELCDELAIHHKIESWLINRPE